MRFLDPSPITRLQNLFDTFLGAMDNDIQPINLAEYEECAKSSMRACDYDYYRGGAEDERTIRENRAAFERIRIAPRMLTGVDTVDASCRVLDRTIKFPAIIAPTAFQRLAHPDAELATAKAAGASGTIMTLSTFSSVDIETVAQAAQGALWFQLYVYKDRGVSEELVRRAKDAGCKALVVTVDAPHIGRREHDIRNGFSLPPDLTVNNVAPREPSQLPIGGSELENYFAEMLDASLNWSDIDRLASIASLPIVIKGILRPDDALRAADNGASAIVVSNHGGRQLDGAIAGIEALRNIAPAVGDRMEIYVDGGVRRGVDIVAALALGARAVMIGRPVLWGLACNGVKGVADVMNLLRNEYELAMALCGCSTTYDISRDLIAD